MKVVVDEVDADRLLRLLYEGRRPMHVHTLICSCGAIADLRESPSAWDGWRVLPTAKCPECLAKLQLVEWHLAPENARIRFLELIESLATSAG